MTSQVQTVKQQLPTAHRIRSVGRKRFLFVCTEAFLLLILSQLTDPSQAKIRLITGLNTTLIVPTSIDWLILGRPESGETTIADDLAKVCIIVASSAVMMVSFGILVNLIMQK